MSPCLGATFLQSHNVACISCRRFRLLLQFARIGPVKFALILGLMLSLPGGTLAQDVAPAPPDLSGDGDLLSDGGNSVDDILNMDLDQLAKVDVQVPSMDVPVSSVSKEESTVGQSAAAVFVITSDMIRRSGATCVPEALRMAPGLEVAQINANSWAISSRGFNTNAANKLLVLIDGRTVYTPVFGGVYWDIQDLLLEDVERIEVIRGPGGTLWGANAVNGIISILTKNSAATQGAYAHFASGSQIRSNGAFRYGGQIGNHWTYRVYGKYFDNDNYYDPTRPEAQDAWNQGRVGFRADWSCGERDSLTIEGEHYVGNTGASAIFHFPTPPYSETRYGDTYNTGQHVLMRYQHVIDDTSDWSIQAYFDNVQRDNILKGERVKTTDVELQYRFQPNDYHHVTFGAGYRYIQDNLPSNWVPYFYDTPTNRHSFVANQFLQDEITLCPDLAKLIVGCKIEQNSYTDFEYQPTIRFLYTPDRKHTAWGAVSRAVHTPTRADEDGRMTLFSGLLGVPPSVMQATGNRDMRSESLLAYELGYRTQATDRFAWDVAAFYNVYDDLATLSTVGFTPPPPYSVISTQWANEASAHTYGVELAANYAVTDNWSLYAQYTYLQLNVKGDLFFRNNDPQNQVYLSSRWNLGKNVDFDLMARYVDSLGSRDAVTGDLLVPSYIEMDLRLAWRPRKSLELAVVGMNLLDTHRYEFPVGEGWFVDTHEVPRSVYGMITWRR